MYQLRVRARSFALHVSRIENLDRAKAESQITKIKPEKEKFIIETI